MVMIATSRGAHRSGTRSGIGGLVAGFRQRREARRAARTLLALDSYLLRDIGLSREDAMAMLREPGRRR